MTADRTRTYGWDDPFALAGALTERSGLELMQLMAAGELPSPPIAHTLGFRLAEVERGRAVFECVPAEFHYNPIGIVHAGLPMTLMDSAMGVAYVTTQDEPEGWTTLEVKSNFTRALTVETGLVRCVGTIVHRGRRVSTTEARVEDAQGRLCAHATSTILASRSRYSQSMRRDERAVSLSPVTRRRRRAQAASAATLPL